ncbi:uncharacterized protein TrAtP1_005512 [Trichoderma atroviride]|uniref:uncharacterized protein n=1 Tax=Hypocrea atroviridis TaxID=63577 RepID=UPI00331A34E9|nr:hypothetical protein TrAtP1_005512 [Trichoderma atroviride]
MLTTTLRSARNPTLATHKGDCQRSRLCDNDGIRRFLADQHHTPPVGLGPLQTEDEAKAAGKARASASIRAFKAQFGCGNTSPETQSECTQK